MELSIVICTYNRSSFLREGLEAIVHQSLAFLDVPIEMIVVDNNSSDDTSSVVEEFQNKFSSLSLVYFLEKQQGISFSRNTAIQNSKGKFIAFVDDDAVVKEASSELVLEEKPEITDTATDKNDESDAEEDTK